MYQVTLKNFRCFREEQVARLAPLTLLVGENSTGKSSFMAMIRALWDLAHWRHRVPDFKEAPYDLGSFDEIAHYRGGSVARAESFEAGFKVALRHNSRERRRAVSHGESYRFSVTFKKRGTVPGPVSARLSHRQAWIEDSLTGEFRQTKFGTSEGVWKLSENFPNLSDPDDDRMWPPLFDSIARGRVEDPERRSEVVALQGSRKPSNEDWKRIDQLVKDYRSSVFDYYSNRPYASAPVRSKPRRTYDPSRPTPDPEGDYVPMYLASIYFQRQNKWKELKNHLESFGKQAGLFDEISIKPLGKRNSEPFQMQVRKFGGKAKGPQRNLIDVGYGVSQVLPVITEILRPDAPSMFLLQQPEVHLHPSAQAALGSLFSQVAGDSRQLVVETHSDHLVDRVRMDIRDGTSKLKPDDVSILFFERGTLEVRIHSLRIDEEGNIVGEPDSYRKFFMEETTRSLGL